MTEKVELPNRELPIPPNFPVEWKNEDEKKLLWRWDDIHSPLPATPMSVSIGELSTGPGGARAAKEMKNTSRGLRKRINGYSYSASAPDQISEEAQREQREAMQEAIPKARNRWDDELLPKIERNHAIMRGLNLDTASDLRLLEFFDEMVKLHREHWYFHMLAVGPMHNAAENMANLYREIFPDAPDEEPYLLFQGIDNKSLETDRALQELTNEARNRPEVANIFSESAEPQAIMQALKEISEGRKFLSYLDDFLSVYGYRPTGFDYIFPTWIEDPSFVILNVKSYLASPPRNLDEEKAIVTEDAQRLLKQTLDKLEGDPRREQFIEAYQRAHELWSLKEDHAFYIDQGSNANMRILIAEMGRRLEKKATIEQYEDVFHLDVAEMKAAWNGQLSPDIKQDIRIRKAERERFMKVTPPPFLGTPPTEDAQQEGNPFQRMMGPAFATRPDENTSALRGISGSAGTATGPAKVVRSPDEFAKVQPGDVLVCTSTSPTWTPLFASVSALVSDSGGALSHTAIVAREYKLPAVVGTKFGTSLIRDGQVITVDGSSGVVMLR